MLLNVLFLTGFAVFTELPVVAIIAMAGVGLVGITLNPAMITSVQGVGGTGALVQTNHSSFVTFGVVVGSWIAGLGINAYGPRAPPCVGAGLAVLALIAVIPAVAGARHKATTTRTEATDETEEAPTVSR